MWNQSTLKLLLGWEDELLELLAPPLMFAKRRAQQFRRQFYLKNHNSTVNSKELLNWIISVNLEGHSVAIEALGRYHGPKENAVAMDKRPDKRELDSVAALLPAMAIEQFGYDPHAKRSPTVKEVQDLAASLGISMSDDTIRHYLRHGAKFIDAEWKPYSR